MGKKSRKKSKKSESAKKVKKIKPKRLGIKILAAIIIGIVLISLFFLNDNHLLFLEKLISQITGEQNLGGNLVEINLPLPSSKTLYSTSRKTRFEDFAGSKSCEECHEKEYKLWLNSTHAKAGGEPGNVKIIAKFDGNPLYFKDAVVTPMINEKKEYIFVVEQQGFPKKIIRVDAVVGGGHMYGGGTQSFFTRMPDGSLRFLPFDFIRKENIWFVQLRDGSNWVPINKDIALADLLQWTPHRMLGNQEGTSNCQNCHGSQILLEYDPVEKKYLTRYMTLQINCESCHGPSKRHNELSKLENNKEIEDLDMAPLATYSKNQSLLVCFQCHAVKDVLQDGYLPGDNPEEYFSLRLPILGSEPYLPDGRIRLFAYQQNHVFSDCYINGSMTCVDCHDPHSQLYRDVFGKPLEGKFDNGQCTGCHASKAHVPELHTHHEPDSTGNLCTGCHMPFLQHKTVGSKLVFSRTDHVIPIPRPIFDTQIGIEDACTKCHRDKSLSWLQEKTDEWYRNIKPHNPITTGIIQSKNVRDIKTAAQLLLHPESNNTVGQVTALTIFIKRFLQPDMSSLDRDIVEKLLDLAEHEDTDLKALALMSLHLALDHDPAVHNYLVETLKNLKDKENAVRKRWALAVDYLGSLYSSLGAIDEAIKAHKKSLEVNPYDAFTWTNLGRTYWRVQKLENAILSYKRALEIKPSQSNIYFRLAELYSLTGKKPETIQTLKELLKLDPKNERAQQILKNLEGFENIR